MKRRTMLAGAVGLAVPGLAGSRAYAGRRRSRSMPPNVLWIITDDQPRHTLRHRVMPGVMNRIADLGCRFPLGYSAVPLCGPARVSMLTSMYPHRHGCHGNIDCLDRFVEQGHDRDTVATRLQEAGYRTGYFGKYMNGHPSRPEYVAPGWNRWVANVEKQTYNVQGDIRSVAETPADLFAVEHCERFIRNSAAVPWFAVLGVTGPHGPLRPSPEHADDWDGASWRPAALNEADMSDKPLWMRDLPLRDLASLQRVYEGKLEELGDVDDWVDRVVSTLAATDQLRHTLIFFVSDNGFLLGEHRLYGKLLPYEESAGIPFLVRGPGIQPGGSSALVSQVDLMPTTLEAAGLAPDAGRVLDGRSMLTPLRSADWTGWRQRMLVEYPLGRWAMLIEGPTRYIDHYERGAEELYDLVDDPAQLRNDPSRVTAEHRARLAALRTASGLALREQEM